MSRSPGVDTPGASSNRWCQTKSALPRNSRANDAARKREDAGRQGRLLARHRRRPRPRQRGDCALGRGDRAARARPAPHHSGLERRDRRGHPAARLDAPAAHHARAAGGRRRRPDGTRAVLRELLSQPRAAHGAGAPHARRSRRPAALSQCAGDAAHAARARRHSGDQRERHGRHRRDQVRRQRHARRAGHEPGGSRCAHHPHRHGGSVRRRSPPEPAGKARRRSRCAGCSARSDGRRRGQRARQGRHADQGPGGAARGAQRRAHRDRRRPRA